MLKIRFRRQGRIHEPFYRIVVAEDTAPIQGKFITMLGHYNPKSKELVLNKEEAIKWMNKGARPSNTVAKLFKNNKISHKLIIINTTKGSSKKNKQIKQEATEEISTEVDTAKTEETPVKEASKEKTE